MMKIGHPQIYSGRFYAQVATIAYSLHKQDERKTVGLIKIR